ncbi:MAG: hypothetical protein WBB74_04605 [Gaiellaceae bacterium]
MEALVLHTSSRASAEGFCVALSELRPKLVENGDGRCHVEISLAGRNDQQIVKALNKIEAYVASRGDGPARLDLDGNRYILHPTKAVEN